MERTIASSCPARSEDGKDELSDAAFEQKQEHIAELLMMWKYANLRLQASQIHSLMDVFVSG